VDLTTVSGGPEDNRAIYLTATTPRSEPIKLRRNIASIAVLHTAVVPTAPDARKTFLQRLLAPVDGVPIATIRLHYAGGATEDIPVHYARDICNWRPTRNAEYLYRCPYLLRLATDQCRRETPGAADAVLVLFEAPVPRSGRVDAIEFIHSGTEADYAIVAVAVRDRKK
jgi:hypothetical protein